MISGKIIITGAGGFVGANITQKLLSQGYEIHAFIRPQSKMWRLKEVRGRLFKHEWNIDKPRNLRKLLLKINPTAIFHLAAYGSYPKQTDRNLMIKTNITALFDLLENSKDLAYRCLIVAGSSSEYGRKNKPMSESDIPEPNNFYAVTKLAGTNLALTYTRMYKKPINVLRLFNVYGPMEEEGRLVRNVIENALFNRPIYLATGKEARDFIYIDDVTDAFIDCLENKIRIYGEVFNIGTGIQTTIEQLARKAVQIIGSKSEIILNAYPGREWDTNFWKADTKKTYRITDWKYKINLEHGLRKTIKWYKNNV